MNFSHMSLLDRRYRITHVLAQHDAETHYAARHVALDRGVLLMASNHCANISSEDDVCAWTMRAAKLRHPILPRVRDCFRVRESMCVVVDEPRGQGLNRRLRERGPLTEREVITTGILVADALDYLLGYDAGLAPLGCINPDAFTFSLDDRVALAYLRPRAWLAQNSTCRCASCRAYLAPEILLGEEADVRADLYSLATVLRRALGLTVPAAMPDSAMAPQVARVSGTLSPILDRAVARDPDERFQSPAEFASALVGAGAELPDAPLFALGPTAHSGQRTSGTTGDAKPTDTAITPPRSAKTDTAERSTDPTSPGPGATRGRVRHSGRRALSAIVSALHICV